MRGGFDFGQSAAARRCATKAAPPVASAEPAPQDTQAVEPAPVQVKAYGRASEAEPE
jgi:hypothetical protein